MSKVKHSSRISKGKNKGFVLSIVVATILLLSLVGAALLRLGTQAGMQSIRTNSAMSARMAADAGLTHAIFSMNNKLEAGGWSDAALPNLSRTRLDYSDLEYKYETVGSKAAGYTISSTGYSDQAEHTVKATLRVKGLFDLAVAVKDSISLNSGSLIAGYNSATGERNLATEIGTNSTGSGKIDVAPGAKIIGDVLVGVGGSPGTVVKNKGSITGNSYDLPDELEFPAVMVPTLTDMGVGLVAKGVTKNLQPAESGVYSSIDLSKSSGNGILKISGGDVVLHITGDIDISQGCGIDISNGSSLTLYLDGDLIAKEGSSINTLSETASSFELYGTGSSAQKIELKASGEFYGSVYAPDATVDIKSGGDIYGAVVADSFDVKSDTTFYYDIALKDTEMDDHGTSFVVDGWSE